MKVYNAMATHPSRVCFVCGSACAQYKLHTKVREKGSYFPFLERHDPPAGAQPPGEDGTVESCRVCYSFLTQQWDSYEQSKTPAMKRLYWLKRTDNGNFTGAEMRLQGEYAAQVMGLQYTPGTYGGGGGDLPSVGGSGFSDYNSHNMSMMSPASSTSTYSYSNNKVASPPKPKVEPVEEGAALDLSVNPVSVSSHHHQAHHKPPPTFKEESQGGGSRRREKDANAALRTRSSSKDRDGSNNPSTMICYLCAAVVPYHMGRYVNSKKNVEGEGHFPFLEFVNPPQGAMPMTPQGLTRICSNCRTSLNRQWRVFESNKTPEIERRYKINDEPVSIYLRQSPSSSAIESQNKRKPTEVFVPHDFQNACYLCGQVYHKDTLKLLYTRPPQESSKHTMFFHFVAQLQKPVGARPMDNEGRVWSCRACYSYLQRQWQNYHNEGVPIKDRQFQLRPLSGITKSEPIDQDGRSSSGHPEHQMHQPLNIDVAPSPVSVSTTTALGLLAIASSHSQPLPVPVTQQVAYRSYPHYISGGMAHPGDGKGQQPQVVKIPEGERSQLRDALANGMPHRDHPKQEDHGRRKALDPTPAQVVSNPRPTTTPAAMPGHHRPTSVAPAPVVCYVCGYDCHNRMYYLDSCPPRTDNGNSAEIIKPFFPFLSRYDAPKKAEKMVESGKVKSCRYCYISLTTQWRHYEKTSGESNRWLWRYIARSYSCYVCGIVAKREEARTISLRAYPGLEHHTLLQGEFQMFVDDTAIVCVRCDRTLLAQTDQFERSCVTARQRNYLDLACALLDEERRAIQQKEAHKAAKAGKDGEMSSKQEEAESGRRELERMSSTEDSNTEGEYRPSVPSTMLPNGSVWPINGTGLPPGSKPPPLTMLSPAGSKIARTTATVPPLNQTSPTATGSNAMNATRASSFAAALRKLAKQAGDPPESGILSRDGGRDPSPAASVSSTSPRAPTPQRSAAAAAQPPPPPPPPLVYSNHVPSTAINSPPVVTVAPTATHSSLVTADNRKSVDRPSVVQNTPGQMIEPLSIKRESEKMTASLSNHDRREDERPHSKESSTPKQHTPHSVITSAAGTSRPDESSLRGFQPYRPGEEIRPTLPHHFATMDPAYPYPSAFMHTAPFPHPAFRFDDPYLIERYRMMAQQTFSPYTHQGILGPHGMHPLLPPGARYPPELLGQHLPLVSPGSKLPDHMSPGGDRSKKEEELRREREEAERERERQREREREQEREKERERERERQRLREREEQERRERERQERERQERERIEREREMERERERERERQLSLERLRAAERDANHRIHPDDRRSPARPEDPANRYGSIMHVAPHYIPDKYRTSAFLPRDQHITNLSKYDEEVRQREQLYQTKERDRQLMHQQFLREQDLLIRERDRRIELEKREREKSLPQPLTSPKTSPEDGSRHVRPADPAFHRPFERPLTNGYERNHYSDYERRAMNEAILAQDRHVLQNMPRSSSSVHVASNHSLDSRPPYEQVYNDRGFLEKQHEGIQARLIESEKSQHHQSSYSNTPQQHKSQHPPQQPVTHPQIQPPQQQQPPQHPHQQHHQRSVRHDRSQQAEYEMKHNSYPRQEETSSNSKGSSNNNKSEAAVPSVAQHFEKSMQNMNSAVNSQVFKYEAVSPVLCSKLDLEEQKLRESRLNGSYVSDESDNDEESLLAEERRTHRLLLIANGPPCALEKSPRKLKFLKHVGLTTNENRSEIDHERRKKRKKLYRERSVSPVIVEEETERQSSPLSMPTHLNHDVLNRDKDYKLKAYFLYPLGLEPVSTDRRREMEIIRQACQREKQRRLKLKPEPPPKPNPTDLNGHTPSQRPQLPAQPGGVKRKHSEIETPPQQAPASQSQQTASAAAPLPDPATASRGAISLGQLHERHIPAGAAASASTTGPKPGQAGAPAAPSRPLAENRAIIFPQDSSRDPKRRISKEFAQEFHESVLQTTRQQQEQARHQNPSRSEEVRYHLDDRSLSGPPAKLVKEEPKALSSDGLSDGPSESGSRPRPSVSNGSPPLRWPGIEAIMEAYQQHLQDHRDEKNVLLEQCSHLKSKSTELTKLAERLSTRMAELVSSKARADEERASHQNAIDGLKKCLKFLR